MSETAKDWLTGAFMVLITAALALIVIYAPEIYTPPVRSVPTSEEATR